LLLDDKVLDRATFRPPFRASFNEHCRHNFFSRGACWWPPHAINGMGSSMFTAASGGRPTGSGLALPRLARRTDKAPGGGGQKKQTPPSVPANPVQPAPW